MSDQLTLSIVGSGGSFGPTNGRATATLGSFPASLTGSFGGAAPNWNRLRDPPASETACTFASRSARRVGSIPSTLGRSSGRLSRKTG